MKWKKLVSEHECELPPEDDPLESIIRGTSCISRYRRAFRRSCLISMTNPRARRMFKSSASVDFERLRHIKTHLYVIHPLSNFRQSWENFMIFVYFYALLVGPFYNAFVSNNPMKRNMYVWTILDAVHCVVCMVDLFINCYTGYIRNTSTQGIVIIPWKILIHYATTYMLIDFGSSFPIDHILCIVPNLKCVPCDHLGNLRYLKILRLRTLGQYFARGCEMYGIGDAATEVTWYLARNLIILHVLACGHMSIAKIDFTSSRTWLSEVIHDDMATIEIYVFALVRTTSNIRLLGYGWHHPDAFLSQLYIAFLSIVGCILLIFFIVLLLKRVNIYNVGSSKYEQKLKEIDTYVRYKQLPSDLHSKIIKFYEFRFELRYFNERQILNDLSTNLRQESLLHSCRRLLLNVSFLNNLPAPLLLRIMLCMHSEIYLVNDVIISAGAIGDCMYFITSGTVAVYTPRGKEVCHLEDGAHFGEVALLTDVHERSASIVAIECCVIYRLDRVDFGRAIAPYPDMLSRIQRVAEERLERSAEQDVLYQRLPGSDADTLNVRPPPRRHAAKRHAAKRHAAKRHAARRLGRGAE